MKRISLLIFAIMVFSGIYAQEESEFDFHKAWLMLQNYEENGLPRSALNVADSIYQAAADREENEQIVKATIYRIKLGDYYKEDQIIQAIDDVQSNMDAFQPEVKAFLHFFIAGLYHSYYNVNRWNIDRRTGTGDHTDADIKTWTKSDFHAAVDEEYQAVFEYKAHLDKTSIKKYPELIEQDAYSFEIQPSLYDFFAHEIADYYTQRANGSRSNQDKLLNSNVFLPAQLFIATDYCLTSESDAEKAIGVLRELLKFRLSDDLGYARVYTDIKRLKTAAGLFKKQSKDNALFEALVKLQMQFEDEPAVRLIEYALADWYFSKAEEITHRPDDTLKAHYYQRADHICSGLIDRFPDTRSAKLAAQMKQNLRRPELNFTCDNSLIPDQHFPILVEYRNLPDMYFTVLKVDRDAFIKVINTEYGQERKDAFMNLGETLRSKRIELPGEDDFVRHTAEFAAEPLDKGFYLFIVSAEKPEKETNNYLVYRSVSISNLSWYSQKIPGENGLRLFVTDIRSGEPVKNAGVKAWERNYNYRRGGYDNSLVKSTKTSDDGSVFFSMNTRRSSRIDFEISKGNDELWTGAQYYYNYNPNREKWQENTRFFTDRAVYRPGQTVHVKGICTRNKGKDYELLKNYTTTLTFKDANHQTINTKTVKTNAYGSFSAELMIPEGLLNGRLSIRTPSGSSYIRLEEYKRPAFEVNLDDPDGNYRLESKVSFSGNAKAYTGASISDAKVKYTVFREPQYHQIWRFGYMPQQREMIAHGTTQTGEGGGFNLSFVAEPLASLPKSQNLTYRFSVEAEVTDITGETHADSKSFVVGYRTLKMNTDLSENADVSELDSIVINTQNLNGETLQTKGSLVLYRLKQPENVLIEKAWNVPEFHMDTKEAWKEMLPGYEYEDEADIENYPDKEKVYSLSFNTADKTKYPIPEMKNLPAGAYRLELRARDAFNMPVIDKEYIRIYNKASDAVAVMNPLHLSHDKFSYEVGEEMEIRISSALENAWVYVRIDHEDDVLTDKWVKLNKSRKTLQFDVTEDMRGGISVSAVLVKNGEMHTKSNNITVPYSNKRLSVKYIHFRNEMLPGEEESIRLKISGPEGEAVNAEMLGTMYDASLDALYTHQYGFSLYYPVYKPASYTSVAFAYGSSTYLIESFEYERIKITGTEPALNTFGMNQYRGYSGNVVFGAMGGAEPSGAKGDAAFSSTSTRTAALEESEQMDYMAKDEKSLQQQKGLADNEKSSGGDKAKANVKVRTDFSETAFFRPQLHTEDNGEVSFTFTAPESLTEWKFMAVAHTEDLKTAVSENKMVTKKKLMVVPNMPRFFREGDQINLSIKVTNLTDQPVEGNLNLHFTDALTGKDVTKSILNGSADDDFSIKANGNTAVDMNLNIPEGLQAIEYKVIASTEKYGDGEQRLVPVLSNRMLVTESMPMYVNGNSSKTWRFKKLSKSDRSGSLKHHKLSLEVTPRPAWYAVQALPYLMEYPYECSEQVFSRYYANSLATHIANSDPEIKRVFEAWRNIPESDALNSNLQKNQDLKANMLEQTPWVLEAKDESQRKRRVGLLFDMERMGREQFSALVKLQKNQVSSGGWPWFEGMPESRYITQHIIAGLSHLKHLDVLDSKQLQEVNPMIRRGLKYLDRELVKDYSRLKSYYSDEEMQQMHISSIHVHYLYARSFNLDDMQVSPSAAHAYKYYYNQAKKYWAEMNNYNKGMIALAMHRNDEKATASDIMASLKEYALFDEEKGMYWKNARGYYWYQAPIETQSLLIEAFDEVAGDTESVERMKQWLLNQKRTQDWKTTKATAEAVYALILTGQNLLDLDAGVVVEIGGKVFDPEKADDVTSEAGTGYFRKDWSGGEITSEMSEVKLTKTGSGMAWGALHWQYFEDMDKITSHETPLKLEKKLYKRINTHDGAELKLLDEKTSLKVGDKLVARIVLKSDRNMEYVHMKDMRASSLEPVSTRSGYRYQDGLGYYESVRDASVDFFFSRLRKGTYVFEYPMYVTHEGEFSNGITSIQCMYAPEYNAHSQGDRIHVE